MYIFRVMLTLSWLIVRAVLVINSALTRFSKVVLICMSFKALAFCHTTFLEVVILVHVFPIKVIKRFLPARLSVHCCTYAQPCSTRCAVATETSLSHLYLQTLAIDGADSN